MSKNVRSSIELTDPSTLTMKNIIQVFYLTITPRHEGRIEIYVSYMSKFAYPPYRQERSGAFNISEAINMCCRAGYLEGLIELAAYPQARAYIARNNSESLRWACERGHTDIVKYLYSNFRNELSATDSYALVESCSNGHTKTVQFLLDNWVTETDVRALDCKAFRMSCEHEHYKIAKLLLDKYQLAIESCDAVFTDDITFRSICRFGQKDMVLRLMPALKAALNRLPIGSMDSAIESLVRIEPVDSVECLGTVKGFIRSSATPKLRKHLVYLALTFSYAHNNYKAIKGIIEEFESDVNPIIADTIFGCYESYVNDHYEFERWALKSMLTYLSTKYRDVISIETYGRALGYACIRPHDHSRSNLTDLFTDDLYDKITPDACLKALKVVGSEWYISRALKERTYLTLIEKFKNKLDSPACNKIFGKACKQEEWGAIVICLNHLGPKLDLSIMPDALLNECLNQTPEIAMTVFTTFNNRMDREAVNALVREQWDVRMRIQILIKCFKDRIDGKALLHLALTRAAGWGQPPFNSPEPVKLIVSEFNADIDCCITVKLLGLTSSVLYYLLGPEGVKELIDAYQHKEKVITAISKLDPNHEHYEYILLDYRPKGIKAATS